MKFKNNGDQKLTFTLDRSYEVEPGQSVDISDNVSFAVKSMGLALESEDNDESGTEEVDPNVRISNKIPTAADKRPNQEPAFHVEPPAPNAPIPGAPPATGSGIPGRDIGGAGADFGQQGRRGSVQPKP